jgi:hypothetical protein
MASSVVQSSVTALTEIAETAISQQAPCFWIASIICFGTRAVTTTSASALKQLAVNEVFLLG